MRFCGFCVIKLVEVGSREVFREAGRKVRGVSDFRVMGKGDEVLRVDGAGGDITVIWQGVVSDEQSTSEMLCSFLRRGYV